MMMKFMVDLLQRAMKIDNSLKRDVHVYHILTALRGPDNNTIELKWLTTARIRSVVFIHNGDANLANGDPLAIMDINTCSLDESGRRKRDNLIGKGDCHFRDHLYQAYESIRVLYDYDLVEERVISKENFEKKVTS